MPQSRYHHKRLDDEGEGFYASDGVTVTDKYLYESNWPLIEDIHIALSTYYTYDYYTEAGMTNFIQYKNEYSFNAADDANILNGTATGTLVATYEYVNPTMVR